MMRHRGKEGACGLSDFMSMTMTHHCIMPLQVEYKSLDIGFDNDREQRGSNARLREARYRRNGWKAKDGKLTGQS